MDKKTTSVNIKELFLRGPCLIACLLAIEIDFVQWGILRTEQAFWQNW
jgi:hypothetical protein